MAIHTNLKSLAPRREQYKRNVRLVSGAFYDRKAFPTGEITVYPWDSVLDAWLTERCRQPKREMALWDATAKVCDLKGCDVGKLLVSDAWTILMVSKSIRNNCVVEYTAVCPNCNTEHSESVRVPDELEVSAKKELDFSGTELITLPETKDAVKVKFLTIADEISISERSPELRNEMSDHLAHVLLPIIEIGGGAVENRQEILTWYNALSPKDADYLDRQQGSLYPHLNTDLPHVCDSCGRKFIYSLDLNTDFFRTGER
jgi:hypothetical protein